MKYVDDLYGGAEAAIASVGCGHRDGPVERFGRVHHGAYTIMMAQAGRLPNLSADEPAYYAAQPFWFVVATDIALFAAVAAAVALLMHSRTGVWLFALSLVAIFITNTDDLAMGTSRSSSARPRWS